MPTDLWIPVELTHVLWATLNYCALVKVCLRPGRVNTALKNSPWWRKLLLILTMLSMLAGLLLLWPLAVARSDEEIGLHWRRARAFLGLAVLLGSVLLGTLPVPDDAPRWTRLGVRQLSVISVALELISGLLPVLIEAAHNVRALRILLVSSLFWALFAGIEIGHRKTGHYWPWVPLKTAAGVLVLFFVSTVAAVSVDAEACDEEYVDEEDKGRCFVRERIIRDVVYTSELLPQAMAAVLLQWLFWGSQGRTIGASGATDAAVVGQPVTQRYADENGAQSSSATVLVAPKKQAEV